jgi:hypothetical protein
MPHDRQVTDLSEDLVICLAFIGAHRVAPPSISLFDFSARHSRKREVGETHISVPADGWNLLEALEPNSLDPP